PTFLLCYVLSALPACIGAVANQGGAPACVCALLLPRILHTTQAATRQHHPPHHLPHSTYSVRCYSWAQAITPGWALAFTSAQGGKTRNLTRLHPSLPFKLTDNLLTP
ncbi:hypothetical protein T484DRAFT_1988118, partial [Baffinella frigidus]